MIHESMAVDLPARPRESPPGESPPRLGNSDTLASTGPLAEEESCHASFSALDPRRRLPGRVPSPVPGAFAPGTTAWIRVARETEEHQGAPEGHEAGAAPEHHGRVHALARRPLLLLSCRRGGEAAHDVRFPGGHE